MCAQVTTRRGERWRDPVIFLWRDVVKNSGGPGQYRGGQGLEEALLMAYSDGMGGPGFNACAEVPPSGAVASLAAIRRTCEHVFDDRLCTDPTL